MQKDTLIGAVVILVVLAGISFYVAMTPSPAQAPGAQTALPLPTGGYSEHEDYYDIEANYATSTPLVGDANAAAIALMQNFVKDTITQFKSDGDFANLTAEDTKVMGYDQGRKQQLQILYLMASSGRTVSYIFTIYTDTLGAHGNTFFKTFTFATRSGVALALADAFTSRSDYLDKLSQISRARLPVVIGQDFDVAFIADGTTPEEENFQNFFFDINMLVILFPPYQVAPYSAGPQTLRIPLSDLSSILKSEYR